MMANTNYPSSSENPQNSSLSVKNNTTKNIIIIALAVALLGTWGYFLYDKNDSNRQIHEKTLAMNTAMSSRDSLRIEYGNTLERLDSLTGDNNNKANVIADRESEIGKLKREISGILSKKNASESELKRAKVLIAELNEKIANLEAENARLNGENQQLAATNTQLSQEKQTLETNLQTTTSEKEELAKTVDVASTFTASNIQITPFDEKRGGKEKVSTTAKKVDKLVVSFDVENRVARSGPADIYVVVTGPDGKVITDPAGAATLTTRNDGDRTYTYKTTVEYEQGQKKTVQVPLRQNQFQTGNYKIEVYQNGFKIAEGVRTLKKGGLFG